MLKKGFTAGERGSTAGLIIKHNVFFDFQHHLLYSEFLPRDFPSFSIADFDTVAAFHADVTDGGEATVQPSDRMILTQRETISAPNAPIIAKKQLLIRRNRFRIVAPFAMERTPL